MRMLFSIMTTLGVALLFSGCSSKQSPTQLATNFVNKQNIIMTNVNDAPRKSSLESDAIAVFTKEHSPLTPYKIIGFATVSKYNLLGRLRTNYLMQTMMKKLAASVGGDGLINFQQDAQGIQANIIQFQKILI